MCVTLTLDSDKGMPATVAYTLAPEIVEENNSLSGPGLVCRVAVVVTYGDTVFWVFFGG